MKSGIRILKQGEFDLFHKDIMSIERSAFLPGERTSAKVYRDLNNSSESIITIFYYNNAPVGCYVAATLEWSSDKDEFKYDKQFGKNNTLYLFSIGVVEQYQKKGMGELMLEHLIMRKKFKRVSFHTRSEGFKHLALKKGFRTIKTTVMDKHKMYYMAKWL